MTKTEKKILDEIRDSGRFVASWISGPGPKGGHINQGMRDYRAAASLIKKGFAGVTHKSNAVGEAVLVLGPSK